MPSDKTLKYCSLLCSAERCFCWLLKLSWDFLAVSSPAISSDLAYSILHSSQAYCNSYKVIENNQSLCCKGYTELHCCQKNKTTAFSMTPSHKPTIWHFLNLKVHLYNFPFFNHPFFPLQSSYNPNRSSHIHELPTIWKPTNQECYQPLQKTTDPWISTFPRHLVGDRQGITVFPSSFKIISF